MTDMEVKDKLKRAVFANDGPGIDAAVKDWLSGILTDEELIEQREREAEQRRFVGPAAGR